MHQSDEKMLLLKDLVDSSLLERRAVNIETKASKFMATNSNIRLPEWVACPHQ
jgi:hypothetical protein